MEILTIELGRRLGLYPILAAGPIDAATAASKAGIPLRYAHEWLSQQAAAGLIDVDDEQRYVLPEAHVPVLVAEESPAFVLGLAPLLLGTALTLPDVATAYATGTGVAYEKFGAEFRDGIGMTNRPTFANDLASWVQHLPEVVRRLHEGGHVLDAGCGVGWSTIALAKAFPNATIVGVDLDANSIADAVRNADAAGVGERVRFVEANTLDEGRLRTEAPNGFALVTIFQALHDMGEPDLVLAGFRRLLAPQGEILVGDEHGGDGTGDAVERMNRAFSTLHCTPATWAESDRVVNGTVLRPQTVREWAMEAGFTRVDQLPIEHPFWWFYRVA
jgi:SAM-dependent methyltransferase